MATGTDLSFIITSEKALDLYDLSGDGSKFFITVNGEYGASSVDFSCNMWPSAYSPYKIEAIKREMDSLANSSFSYMTAIPDVSFVMSVASGGGSLHACTKFNVNQGDKNVSCLPAGQSGTHALNNMIFYNLYDNAGGWYQKMDVDKVSPSGRYVRVNVFSQNGDYTSFFTRIGLYTSVANAENHTPTGNADVAGNTNGDLVHYAYTLGSSNITSQSGNGSVSDIHTQSSVDLPYNSWNSNTNVDTHINAWQGKSNGARKGSVYQIDLGSSFKIKAVNLGWMRQYASGYGENKTLIEWKIGDTTSDMKPFYVGWSTSENGSSAGGKYWTHEPTRSSSGFTTQYLEESNTGTYWSSGSSVGAHPKGSSPGSNGAITCTTTYESPAIPSSWTYTTFNGAVNF